MRTHMLILGATMVAAAPAVAAAQALETETARPPGHGVVVAGVGVEIQTSSEGTQTEVPTFVEGGIGDRLELVIEQVAVTALRPKMGTRATGLGDLEVTLLGLAVREQPRVPAIAFAAEVKLPTARNALIGTGETDYTGYLVLSKRFGSVDLHVNGSYAIIGDPPGVNADNVFGAAVAARYRRGRLDVFGEAMTFTAALPEGAGETEQGGELVGGETVGTIGAGYRVRPGLLLTLGVTVDNNAAVMFHPGLTYRGHLF